jgi:ribosomal protein S18 acetylase RimI-like enzyme
MTIACVDWRQRDAGDLAALYAAEIRRWSGVLGWDTESSWDQIELGRRLGTVSGLLALDAQGAIAGWTFYLLHRDILQIGGCLATSEAATTALVDGILSSAVAARARAVMLFAFTDAPGLADALTRHGLAVNHYEYLSKTLGPEPEYPRGDVRPWREDDVAAVAALLATTYPGADEARPFAPRGTVTEWQEYVGQIVTAAGCGTILPGGCFVVPRGPDRLAGAVLVTTLAATTAHIAQIAVEPEAQGRGLGRVLLDAACASARHAGCRRITLLVQDRNNRARQLYEASGFAGVARFVAAGSRQPLRLTSVAAGGGVVTRL